MSKLLAVIILCIFIGGCGPASVAPSETHLRAVEFNRQAEGAFGKGDYKTALDFYNEALRINRSIENIDGIAINLINMAAVYRKSGDKDNAHRYADEVLGASGMTYPPSRLSEAAFIKAMLQIDDGRYDTASHIADKALSFCRDAECTAQGRIYNLKARIALLKGDPVSALSFGTLGFELNKRYADHEETANSLRCIADAHTAMNNYEGAREMYENALLIDKTLGLSRKIAMDLMGIGNALFKQGRQKDALGYFKRAHSVSEAAGDKQGIRDASSMIEKCL